LQQEFFSRIHQLAEEAGRDVISGNFIGIEADESYSGEAGVYKTTAERHPAMLSGWAA
jgi:hypothetical protein